MESTNPIKLSEISVHWCLQFQTIWYN
jgi:hypothetical protein